MNKIYSRKHYDFKEDLKSGLVFIFGVSVIAFGLSAMAWGIDKIDQHKETATVISVQALDEQIVTFETADGNTWEYTFDYDREIKPQNKAELTFKEYEDADITNDKIVNVKWVE